MRIAAAVTACIATLQIGVIVFPFGECGTVLNVQEALKEVNFDLFGLCGRSEALGDTKGVEVFRMRDKKVSKDKFIELMHRQNECNVKQLVFTNDPENFQVQNVCLLGAANDEQAEFKATFKTGQVEYEVDALASDDFKSTEDTAPVVQNTLKQSLIGVNFSCMRKLGEMYLFLRKLGACNVFAGVTLAPDVVPVKDELERRTQLVEIAFPDDNAISLDLTLKAPDVKNSLHVRVKDTAYSQKDGATGTNAGAGNDAAENMFCTIEVSVA